MHEKNVAESLEQVLYGGTIVFLLLAGFVIFFLLMYMRRKAKNRLEKQALEAKFQEEMLKAQIEIQEQTLRTISQEIHDNIGQVLSLAKINLATMDITRQEQLQTKIASSKELVSKAIQDLRDLSRSMNTDNIEAIGFLRAVEYEVEMMRKSGFQAALHVEGHVIRLTAQKELILFRIVQEIMSNVIRHANASAIWIEIHYTQNGIQMIIRDNGRGFDPRTLAAGGGLGIRNMHHRARLIGAAFSMSSTEGEGATITINVPSENHPANHAS